MICKYFELKYNFSKSSLKHDIEYCNVFLSSMQVYTLYCFDTLLKKRYNGMHIRSALNEKLTEVE